MKYTKENYEKTTNILGQIMNIAKAINNSKIYTSDIVQEGITIDD